MSRHSYGGGEDSTDVNPPANHVWDPDVAMPDAQLDESDSDVEDASDSDVEEDGDEDGTTDGNPGGLRGHMAVDSRMLVCKSSIKGLLARLGQLSVR